MIKLKKMNKKGDMAFDPIAIFLVLIVVVVFALPIIYSALAPIIDEFAERTHISPEGTAYFQNLKTYMPKIIDYFALFTIIAIFMGVLVSAWLVDSNFIFFPVAVLIYLISLIAVAVFATFSDQWIRTFGTVEVDTPIIFWVATNLYLIIVVSGLLIGFVLYGKARFNERIA